MLLIIIIAFISLITLLVLHEFSHFAMAKKFGIEVEEFGIGYPPRIVGKKIGSTVYSLNLLPFGAFVKIPEDKLRQKPIWQRVIIIAAGIISFWIISVILISVILNIGAPMQVSDDQANISDPRVQIVLISPDSPAEEAGLELGDIIVAMRTKSVWSWVRTVKGVQDFTSVHKGEDITLAIKRGEHTFDVDLFLRTSFPQGQGPIGVGLARIAVVKYSFFEAIWQALVTAVNLTWQIISAFYEMIKNAILRKPVEAELMGPVGILDIFVKAGSLGPTYFLQTIVLISLHVAVINALPIPVTDGGRLMFLLIEKIRKKPIDEKLEQRINTVFFILLIILMIFVTMKDILRIF